MVIELYCDGGTRGNVICCFDKSKGSVNVRVRKGVKTNNELEYLGLIYAIEYARTSYPSRKISIKSDSKLIVNQVNDKWMCNPPSLKRLLNKVKGKMTPNITVTWVPRDFNLAGIHLEQFY